MANLLTVSRVALIFVIMAVWTREANIALWWLDLWMVPLLIWAIFMDALDGWAARRWNEESEAGALIDITGDRIVELSLWAFFATRHDTLGQPLVSLAVPVAMIARTAATDLVRSVAFRHGKTPFGPASLQSSAWAYQLTASRWSRSAYGILKAVCFAVLGLLLAWPGAAPAGARLVVDALVALTVGFSLVRAVPVLWDGRCFLFPPRTDTAAPGADLATGNPASPLVDARAG